jgi:hypothetical protein
MNALRKEALEIAEQLETAANALKQMPEYANIFGFSDDPYTLAQERPRITVNRNAFDAEKLQRLIQDIRSTAKRITDVKDIL